MIGVEPEVVKRPVANRISVLISRKRFRAPGDRVWICRVNIPRRTAISGVSYRPIMRNAGLLRWRMKLDVADIDSGSQGYTEGLNRPIEVLVVNGVLVMPHAGRWIRYFINNERTTIDTRLRLDRYAS